MDAREALRAAHARNVEAGAALDAARKTTAAARSHLADVERDLARHVARRDGARDARRRQIVAAVKSGVEPGAEAAGEAPGAILARIAAEDRRAAAAAALETLQGEEREAEAELQAAKVEIAEAANRVAAAEAEAIARELADLETQAMALRVKLGGRQGYVGTLPVSSSTKAILRESDATQIGETNTRLWREARRCAESWRDFVAGLLADADTEIDFEEIAASKAA